METAEQSIANDRLWNRRVICHLDRDFLISILMGRFELHGWPDDAVILSVTALWDRTQISVMVASESFAEVRDGDLPPVVASFWKRPAVIHDLGEGADPQFVRTSELAQRMREYMATRCAMTAAGRIEHAPQWYQVATEWLDQGAAGVLGRSWDRCHDAAPDLWQPLPNVWLGVSVENQAAANDRIPCLLQTPAAVRFLSCEPLLGPLEIGRQLSGRDGLGNCNACGHPVRCRCDPPFPAIDWVIVGRESAQRGKCRPCDVAWVRSIVHQCRAAGVSVFVKQMGSLATMRGGVLQFKDKKGGDPAEWPENLRVRQYPRSFAACQEQPA